MGVRWVSDVRHMGIGWVSDGCRMGVGWVSDGHGALDTTRPIHGECKTLKVSQQGRESCPA